MSQEETYEQPGFIEFWREATRWKGSASPLVIENVVMFGLLAAVVTGLAPLVEERWRIKVALPLGPHEMVGVVLGLLLVLRVNAGYDRWWEARKLWGGIVNQSRNLAIDASAFAGNQAWREQMLGWIAAFSHVCKRSLRGQHEVPEAGLLLGAETAAEIAAAPHMPSYVALRIGRLLREAADQGWITQFAYLQMDRERASLIDHIGACERILKTPLPGAIAIKVRRFLLMFLLSFPFALLQKIEQGWLIPALTIFVSYPLLSLDQIGVELQNPFDPDNLNHLPLDEICGTIDSQVRGLRSL